MTKSEWSRRVLPTSPFQRDEEPSLPPACFEAGDRVSHDKHGLGRVVRVEDGEAVIVDFGESRRRIPTSSSLLNKL